MNISKWLCLLLCPLLLTACENSLTVTDKAKNSGGGGTTTPGSSLSFAGIDSMYLPVAHAEGKFVPRDEQTLRALHSAGQIVLRYGAPDAAKQPPVMAPGVAYPDNPNGSLGDIAGVCDESGRVCGLMPHPERHLDVTQHPRWTRRPLSAAGDGLRVFRNAVGYFR